MYPEALCSFPLLVFLCHKSVVVHNGICVTKQTEIIRLLSFAEGKSWLTSFHCLWRHGDSWTIPTRVPEPLRARSDIIFQLRAQAGSSSFHLAPKFRTWNMRTVWQGYIALRDLKGQVATSWHGWLTRFLISHWPYKLHFGHFLNVPQIQNSRLIWV